MAFPSPLAQPPHALPAPVPEAPAGLSAGALPFSSSSGPPSRRGRSAPVWLFALVVVIAFGLVSYLVSFLGVAAAVAGMVLAFIPLAVVLIAVRLIDRWEPEPRSLMLAAVLWGAVVAVSLALSADLVIAPFLRLWPAAAAEVLSAVVQAPLVEEVAKGLGLLLILVVGRRAFDGPVDGVVYGALVGAGFAFTENILYFATSIIEGGVQEVTFTFLLRGVLSPFAHVMFTAVTGFALGLAVRSGRTGRGVLGAWTLGLAGAVSLHALWNGSAVFADFFALYVTLQVPLFVLFVGGIVVLRREEARLTRQRLSDYSAAGWFSAAEVEMLATSRGRRAALSWARSLPGDRSAQMRAFIAEATKLAAARQRAVVGRDRGGEDERVYLERAMAARAAVRAPGDTPV